jgi:hypothetical protein
MFDRSADEVEYLHTLNSDEVESLIWLVWMETFAGQRTAKEAIALEFSILVDNRLGSSISALDRTSLLASQHAMLQKDDNGDAGLDEFILEAAEILDDDLFKLLFDENRGTVLNPSDTR